MQTRFWKRRSRQRPEEVRRGTPTGRSDRSYTAQESLAILDFLRTSQRWVARRTESVEFIDETTNWRTTTIEFDTPPSLDAGALVPIGLHDRDHTARREVLDVRGVPQVSLTAEEERQLVATGLGHISFRLPDSATTFGSLDFTRRHDLLHASLTDEHQEGDEHRPPEPLGADQNARSELESIFIDRMASMLRPFVGRRLVLFPSSGGEHRQMVTERHAEPATYPTNRGFALEVTRKLADESDAPPMPWSWKLHDDDFPITIPAIEPLETGSFHLEVVAPPGTCIDPDRSLFVVTAITSSNGSYDPAIIAAEETDFQIDLARFHIDPRDHFTKHHVLEAAAAIVLRPLYAGHLRVAAIVAALATSILVLVTATHGWQQAGWETWFAISPLPRPEATVTVLLVVPTLFLAVLINADEHPVTKAVYWNVRVRLGALLVLTVAAALTIGLDANGAWVGWGLITACVIAGWLTIRNGVSALRSRKLTRFPRTDGSAGHPVGRSPIPDEPGES